jgi:hypothetical protein
MVDSFRRQCKELPKEQIKRIVAVTHHLPFRQMVRYMDDLKWDFFAAFMGSERLGEALREDARITDVICGHAHRKCAHRIDGIRVVSSPIGYNDEWQSKEFRKVASGSINIIEVEH